MSTEEMTEQLSKDLRYERTLRQVAEGKLYLIHDKIQRIRNRLDLLSESLKQLENDINESRS